jgi:hypothetical protein
VWWFTRSQEMQKGAAEIISKHFMHAGLEALTVYFEDLDRERTHKFNAKSLPN